MTFLLYDLQFELALSLSIHQKTKSLKLSQNNINIQVISLHIYHYECTNLSISNLLTQYPFFLHDCEPITLRVHSN